MTRDQLADAIRPHRERWQRAVAAARQQYDQRHDAQAAEHPNDPRWGRCDACLCRRTP